MNLLGRAMRRIGRAVEPLVDPDAADRRARDRATAKRLESLTTAVAHLADQVQRVTDRIDKIDRRQIEHVGNAVTTLESTIRSQTAFADKLRQRGRADVRSRS